MKTRYAAYVAAVVRRPRLATFLMLAFCAPALWLTVQFFSDIRAGLGELLPKNAPSVRALEVLHDRIGGGQSNLTVIAQSDAPEQNRAFIKELAGRLEAGHFAEVRSVQSSVAEERQWASDRAPLLMEKEKFDSLMGEVDKSIHDAKESVFDLGLDDDQGKPAKRNFAPLEKKFDEELQKNDRFKNGFLETSDGKTVVLLAWLNGSDLELDPAAQLERDMHKEIDAIRGKYPKTMIVAFNGDVANIIEEHDAILADLSLSSVLVFLLVGALIVAYFRSLRSILAVGAALVPGLLVTFAAGRLSVHHLNSNTAFLGSIIVGNGINYPLLLLAYYRARPIGESMTDAIVAAAGQALPGTLGAAVTASAAYGGLAASSLRGFSQFGWLGGAGMLTIWLFTFITLPMAIALFNPPRQAVQQTWAQRLLGRFYSHPWLPRFVALGFLTLAASLAAFGAVRAYRTGLYETDMKVIRNRESLAHGASSWDQKMNEVFGVWLNPIAGVVDDPADRETLAASLRDKLQSAPPVAERIETITALVPPADEQARRLDRMKKVAVEVKRVPPAELPEKIRPYILSWVSDKNLQPITLDEVPSSLKHSYLEKNGRADRTVLVFPRLGINFDDANNIIGFANRLQQAPLPKGAVVGGAFMFMAEIVRLVRSEAPRVIGIVCLLVALVLLPIFWRHKSRIPVSVLTIAVVAIASQLIMVAVGVRINMLNFAAMPITIGVGSDYIVNLLAAMDAFKTSARQACVRMGAAIALCSLTTIVGYFSLVIASSGALSTFGWAAVLGELMAVTTVLLVVPSFLPSHE